MVLLREELSIVVCSKSDHAGLMGTLVSLRSLVADLPKIILILSLYTKLELEVIRAEFTDLALELIDVAPQGIYHAQNLGLNKANTRLALFLNGGDKLANPAGVKNLVSKLGHNSWGYGTVELVETQSQYESRYKFRYNRTLHRLGLKYAPHPGTVVNVKQAIKYGGFDENYPSAADHKLLLEFSKYSSPVVVKDLISIFYRGGLSSRNQVEVVNDCKNISRELFGYFLKNKVLDSLIWRCVLLVRLLAKH